MHNHLRDDVLLYFLPAPRADVLTCAVRVGFRRALLSSDIGGRAWQFFGLAQTLELASGQRSFNSLRSRPARPPVAARVAAVAAALPPSPPPRCRHLRWWTVVNGRRADARMRAADAAATRGRSARVGGRQRRGAARVARVRR